MNLTHIHLITNHIPVIGTGIGILILLLGMYRKSLEVQFAAYFILIASTFGAIIAYFSGEPAIESVEYIFDVSERSIEAHADAARITFFSMLILAMMSLIAMLIITKKPLRASAFAQIVLLVAAISFGLAAYTANLGGKIRHTEISQKSPNIMGEEPDEEIYE
jgi:hypothetical protein